MVNVGVKDGRVEYISELRGDSVADVLTYVEYDPKDLVERFRKLAENRLRTNDDKAIGAGNASGRAKNVLKLPSLHVVFAA